MCTTLRVVVTLVFMIGADAVAVPAFDFGWLDIATDPKATRHAAVEPAAISAFLDCMFAFFRVRESRIRLGLDPSTHQLKGLSILRNGCGKR
jgi:hypothetical protein